MNEGIKKITKEVYTVGNRLFDTVEEAEQYHKKQEEQKIFDNISRFPFGKNYYYYIKDENEWNTYFKRNSMDREVAPRKTEQFPFFINSKHLFATNSRNEWYTRHIITKQELTNALDETEGD